MSAADILKQIAQCRLAGEPDIIIAEYPPWELNKSFVEYDDLDREDYFRRCKALLEHYRDGREIEGCPLCQGSYGCLGCPWVVFEGETCCDYNTRLYTTPIFKIRDQVLDLENVEAQKWRGVRIEMLGKWMEALS